MTHWKPDRLLKLILIWTSFTFIINWLPAVRGLMDGPTYTWGNFFGMGGSGISGDYWFPVVSSFAGIGLLYLGWRGARQPFHWLILAWHLFLAGGAIWFALQYPDQFRFRGDTLGIDISLSWLGPVLFGGFALLGIRWVITDLPQSRNRSKPEWTPKNKLFLWIVIGMLPLQFVLLRFGEPHGTTDQIGVLLTITQWMLINAALYPWAGRK